MTTNQTNDPPSFTGEQRASAYGATDRGRVRENNQDQFLVAELNKAMSVACSSLPLENRVFGTVQGELLMVADGMGGHAAGEKASRLAITHLVRQLLDSVHWFFEEQPVSKSQFQSTLELVNDPAASEDLQVDERERVFINELREALKEVHTTILLASAQHAAQRGMGTTLTMALMVGPSLYVLHAGDSRCYLVRNQQAEQLTTDHTLARQMVEAGGLKPEEEASSKWSNVLWNVLGGRADGEVIADVRRVVLSSGDAIVLCSDGLHRYVDAKQISEVVTTSDSPAEACQRLIKLANEAGGEDNITVVVSKPEFKDLGESTWVDDAETKI